MLVWAKVYERSRGMYYSVNCSIDRGIDYSIYYGNAIVETYFSLIIMNNSGPGKTKLN